MNNTNIFQAEYDPDNKGGGEVMAGAATIRISQDKPRAVVQDHAGIRISPEKSAESTWRQMATSEGEEGRQRKAENKTKRKRPSRRLTRDKIIDEFCGQAEMII